MAPQMICSPPGRDWRNLLTYSGSHNCRLAIRRLCRFFIGLNWFPHVEVCHIEAVSGVDRLIRLWLCFSEMNLLEDALALHRRGAIIEAAARYAELLRADPRNADAYYYLGMIACQAGDFAQGSEQARQSIACNPRHARAHVLLGRALDALGQHQEALESFNRAISLAPDLAEGHSHRADVLSDIGRKIEAIESYDRALLLAPHAVEDWSNRGLALAAVGRREEAVSSFDRAIADAPDRARAHLWRAKVLSDLGRDSDALASVDKALAIEPSLAEAWLGRGNVLAKLKRCDEAFTAYDKALATDRELAEAWLGRGNLSTRMERYDDALTEYERALALSPDLAEAWLGHGNVFLKLERYGDALADYNKCLLLYSDLAEAWLGHGNVLFELRRYDDSLTSYDRAVQLKTDLADAWLGRGNALVELRRYHEALEPYEKALALGPELPEAWLGRGNVFTKLDRLDDAIVAYDKALRLNPDFAEAWTGRGNILAKIKRRDDAMTDYDRALSLRSDIAEAWVGRGNVFFELTNYDDASAAYDKALALKPELPEAWLGRGNCFFRLVQHETALTAFDKALELDPHLAEAKVGRGNVLKELKRYDEATTAYNEALALTPALAEAWLGLGNVLTELKRYRDAIGAYSWTLALNPDSEYAASFRLHAKQCICDWTEFDADAAELLSITRRGELTQNPFVLLAIDSLAADQLQCAERYIEKNGLKISPMSHGEVYSHDRIRIAYLSADFYEHPIGQLTAGLFEQHDRSQFEVTAISFGPDQNSAIRQRLRSSFDRFVDVADKSDQQIADCIRGLEIDIAVDLMGFTMGNRCNVLARRPAPIQVNYLGYPGTMGAHYIDYIVADPIVIPEEHFPFYSEKVVWLPDCYQANDDKNPISPIKPTRSSCGLPETGFVFCCFNNSYKIGPDVFSVWMRLLAVREDSVLWLIASNPAAEHNLRQEASKRGIAPDRLIFAPKMPPADHLARQRKADLFLDTLHYNAHTTARDALWAGVPLLTCIGSTFAGRVAASLLKAVGLDELITNSLDQYEALALKLAGDSHLLASIRERLVRRNPHSLPLFNTQLFTRHIEQAYLAMYKRHRAGLPPHHIDVPRAGH
jgi:protein O-GlcNAc transferase